MPEKLIAKETLHDNTRWIIYVNTEYAHEIEMQCKQGTGTTATW